jgi:hypothetical protein
MVLQCDPYGVLEDSQGKYAVLAAVVVEVRADMGRIWNAETTRVREDIRRQDADRQRTIWV